MTHPIEINRYNWDGRRRTHSGAWHFVARHRYCAYDPASSAGLVDPGLSQYEGQTDVLGAAQ